MINQQELPKLCKYLYGIFALSAFTQIVPATMIFGMLVMTFAIILLYIQRPKSADTYLHSHFQWLIRTFWIGGGVYLPVVTVIAFCIIYPNLDMTSLYDAVASGQVSSAEQMSEMLMAQNKWLFTGVFLALGTPFLVWWVYRCWKGYQLLRVEKAVDDFMSWL